jgi:hypothetical protein
VPLELRLERERKQLVLQELLEQPVPLGLRQLELQVLEQRPLEQPSWALASAWRLGRPREVSSQPVELR